MLGSLEPSEILYEYDGEPLTYVARDPTGELLLVHSLCVFERISRYLVCAVDERIVGDLGAGRLDLRSALCQPRTWIADIGEDGAVLCVWRVAKAAVPAAVLPRPGVMLKPEQEALFRVRLLGEGVGQGPTSAIDVRMAAQAAETSLKRLAEVTQKRRKRTGRPVRQVRRYSNLPVLDLRAASFEIAFSAPPPEPRLSSQDAEIIEEMGQLLGKGLRMVRSDSEAEKEGLDRDEIAQLLEVVKSLTPPTQGDIDRIEIGGRLLEPLEGPVILTREDRRRALQKIKRRRRALPAERPFLVTGRIPEADKDAFTFTLREVDPQDLPGVGPIEEIPFHFREHLFDIVMDAFNSPDRVIVVGERLGSDFLALDVQFVGEASPEASEPSALVSE